MNWACEQVRDPESRYIALSCVGHNYLTAENADPQIATSDLTWKRFPAYHLIARDGAGITLVNIGVGPSNAKNICDHLAVLRPHAWLMIGHCGGLRESQKLAIMFWPMLICVMTIFLMMYYRQIFLFQVLRKSNVRYMTLQNKLAICLENW